MLEGSFLVEDFCLFETPREPGKYLCAHYDATDEEWECAYFSTVIERDGRLVDKQNGDPVEHHPVYWIGPLEKVIEDDKPW